MSRFPQMGQTDGRPTTPFFGPNQPRYQNRGRLGPGAFENPRTAIPPPVAPTSQNAAGKRQFTVRDMYTPAEDMRQSIPERPQPKRKRRSRFGRRWCIWSSCCVLTILFIVLLTILVIFPAVINKAVKNAPFEIKSVTIRNPRPTSFEVEQLASFKGSSAFKASIAPMHMTLYQRSRPDEPVIVFAEVDTPELKTDKTVVMDNAVGKITNLTEFASFSKNVLQQETFKVSIQGWTKVSWGGLHTNVKVDRELFVKGLNNFQGYEIRSAAPLIPAMPDGTNLLSNITIPNHTPFSIALGNVTLDINIKSTNIGTAYIYNMVMQPGNNTYSIQAKLDQEKMFLLLPDYSDGVMPISATGRNSTFNGQEITFLETAFAGNTFTRTVNASLLLDRYLKTDGVKLARMAAPFLTGPAVKVNQYGDELKQVAADAPWLVSTMLANVPSLMVSLSKQDPALLRQLIRGPALRSWINNHPIIVAQWIKDPAILQAYSKAI